MITKEDKLEQLEIFYKRAKFVIEQETTADTIIVPFVRGVDRVEVVFTKPDGTVETILIHDPQ